MSLTLRSRCAATLATAALTALTGVGVTATGAAAQPQSVKSMDVQWADVDPPMHPSIFGTLTIGGIYTCTAPAGTTVPVSFSALQLMPIAMPNGSGQLPCGPGVVDAPWSLTSFPTTDVHYGYVSVMTTFDGTLITDEFTV
ncbi:hypothetical protein ABZ714_33320 [Streptomyces sp. NPDC006798]|uniref:hypothetical protein n=1 Tax=Streptomyces sp. NPDC006798 TaxID=3155462 RepID=UPI0033CF16E4